MTTTTPTGNTDHAPFSPEAEASVLGACIAFPGAFRRVADTLTASDFYSFPHRVLWEALTEMEPDAHDVMTLHAHLADGEQLDRAGGIDYLAGLLDAVPTDRQIEYHAEIVAKRSAQRQLAAAGRRLQQDATEGGADIEKLKERFNETLDGIGAGDAIDLTADTADIDEPLPDWLIRMSPDHGGGAVMAVGEVSMLSSAGGSGKSSLAVQLAHAALTGGTTYTDFDGNEVEFGHAAGLDVRAGKRVVFLTLEDGRRHIAHRHGMIASDSWTPAPPPRGLHPFVPSGPLMVGSDDTPGLLEKGPQWTPLWRAIRAMGPVLVVIDPAFAALGANANDASAVRQFMLALRAEAEAGQFGILLIHHSSKAARFDTDDSHPGYLQGSTQFPDSARGCLYMLGYGEDGQAIVCAKSNHGPRGWAVVLEPDVRYPAEPAWGTRFAGYRRVQRYSAVEWAKHKAEMKGGAQTEPDGTPKLTAADRHDEAVLAALEKLDGWASKKSIRSLAKLSGANAADAIVRLTHSGQVEERSNPVQPKHSQYRLDR